MGDATALEVRALLEGLATTVRGPASASVALQSDPPDISRDAPVFGVFVVFFFGFNWGFRLLVVGPLQRLLVPSMSTKQATKFAQSFMEAIFYGVFTVLGLCVVPSQVWVWPSEKWWIGFTEGGHEMMRVDHRCYYIMYIARYFQMIISVLMEPRRKDFVEMLIHHVVTVVVIYMSYIWGWNRIGVVTMVLLDPADVPLHLAKLCKYCSEATKHYAWAFLADRLFEIFALIFFVTRLVAYAYVVWSAVVEGGGRIPNYGGPAGKACIALLFTLLLLQLYWFYLILKVAQKLAQGNNVEDVRSDDEDESEKKKQ